MPMRNHLRFTIIVIAAIAAVSLSFAVPQAPTPAFRPRRMADGHPDLNGIWQAMVTANWDVQDHDAQPGPHPEIIGEYGAGPAGQSIVEGGEIPYQPWAL